MLPELRRTAASAQSVRDLFFLSRESCSFELMASRRATLCCGQLFGRVRGHDRAALSFTGVGAHRAGSRRHDRVVMYRAIVRRCPHAEARRNREKRPEILSPQRMRPAHPARFRRRGFSARSAPPRDDRSSRLDRPRKRGLRVNQDAATRHPTLGLGQFAGGDRNQANVRQTGQCGVRADESL